MIVTDFHQTTVAQLYDLERTYYYQTFLRETLKSIYEDGVNVIGALGWSFVYVSLQYQIHCAVLTLFKATMTNSAPFCSSTECSMSTGPTDNSRAATSEACSTMSTSSINLLSSNLYSHEGWQHVPLMLMEA